MILLLLQREAAEGYAAQWTVRSKRCKIKYFDKDGHPVEEIAKATGQRQTLLLWAPRGRSALSATVLGSVSYGVIHNDKAYPRTHREGLIVKGFCTNSLLSKKEKNMIPQIKKILYATDLTKNSAYAFFYAVDMAKKHNASIVILHTIEPISPRVYGEGSFRVEEVLKKSKKQEAGRMISRKLRKTSGNSAGKQRLKLDPPAFSL